MPWIIGCNQVQVLPLNGSQDLVLAFTWVFPRFMLQIWRLFLIQAQVTFPPLPTQGPHPPSTQRGLHCIQSTCAHLVSKKGSPFTTHPFVCQACSTLQCGVCTLARHPRSKTSSTVRGTRFCIVHNATCAPSLLGPRPPRYFMTSSHVCITRTQERNTCLCSACLTWLERHDLTDGIFSNT